MFAGAGCVDVRDAGGAQRISGISLIVSIGQQLLTGTADHPVLRCGEFRGPTDAKESLAMDLQSERAVGALSYCPWLTDAQEFRVWRALATIGWAITVVAIPRIVQVDPTVRVMVRAAPVASRVPSRSVQSSAVRVRVSFRVTPNRVARSIIDPLSFGS